MKWDYSFFILFYTSLTERNPRNSKGKAPVQYQRDEDSRASDHDYQRESPLMQETSEPVWVNPQFSNSPRDPVLLPSSGDDTYRFCHETRGFAVLVINSEFDSEPRRKNADDDERYMSKMFKELDFDVRVLKNLSAAELLEKMEGISISVSHRYQDIIELQNLHVCSLDRMAVNALRNGFI